MGRDDEEFCGKDNSCAATRTSNDSDASPSKAYDGIVGECTSWLGSSEESGGAYTRGTQERYLTYLPKSITLMWST